MMMTPGASSSIWRRSADELANHANASARRRRSESLRDLMEQRHLRPHVTTAAVMTIWGCDVGADRRPLDLCAVVIALSQRVADLADAANVTPEGIIRVPARPRRVAPLRSGLPAK
jgi:hypothetical protein